MSFGCISRPKYLLRDRLAKCWHLQRWQGNTWTEEQLKERIYVDVVPIDLRGEQHRIEKLRPFVIISNGQIDWSQNAAPNGFAHRGSLLATFEQNPAKTPVDPEQWLEFDNLVEQTIESGNNDEPGLVELMPTEGGYDQIIALRSYVGDPEDKQARGDWMNHEVGFMWWIPQ